MSNRPHRFLLRCVALSFAAAIVVAHADISAQQPASSADIQDALAMLRDAQSQFRTVDDYSCVFIKQEKVSGRLLNPEYIQMKVRNRPFSVYMNWLKPHQGREIIYVEGKNGGKILAHDTGAKKVVGGTVALDPTGKEALRYARHPITSAGIGNLMEKVIRRWQSESRHANIRVSVRNNAKVDGRPCYCLEVTRPYDPQKYKYYRDCVYIDKRTRLPIRFEGYGWPVRGGSRSGDPLEIYTYRDVRFNVALTATDFSTSNRKYNFGRL